MTTRLKRFSFALLVAVIIAAGSILFASAQTQTPTPAAAVTSSESCGTCHPEYYAAWQSGAHSKSRTDHVMQEASNCVACHKGALTGDMSIQSADTLSKIVPVAGQTMESNACTQCHVTGYNPVTGKWREDGVACEACHSPIPANHPEQDIPVNKTTELCRNCHTEARFGWDEWKVSVHFQNNIVCTTCHDSHSTAFKLSNLSDSDASSLCQNCHKDVATDSQHSAHSKAGVTCINCHLGAKTGPDVFHQVPDHSFTPKLETCNGCHANEMHGSIVTGATLPDATPTTVVEVPTPTATPKVENITPMLDLSETPASANVMGFIGMAAVLGLVGGFVVSMARKR
jgi:predicted CXXCH cytochrome family protein